MLAMLWLELASLLFNGCGFDPFGLQAQSSQSKISGLPPRKTDNSFLIVEQEKHWEKQTWQRNSEWGESRLRTQLVSLKIVTGAMTNCCQ